MATEIRHAIDEHLRRFRKSLEQGDKMPVKQSKRGRK